ncbi:hypothetical protein DERP_002792 [Dermatophagoides pteronyssinus]|uniref:Uncharacterized protein n=1 Tax=Dermatophagoides pteronyssinus TaxID=6956 RepID=A0ABQ8JW94_DERPT|nr:hypothetical protein DERP_002792 [Dermatophagoides pteronyssinus]
MVKDNVKYLLKTLWINRFCPVSAAFIEYLINSIGHSGYFLNKFFFINNCFEINDITFLNIF